MKTGRPFRVNKRREGVSIEVEQLPKWRTPARALPLLQAFTTNFIFFFLFSSSSCFFSSSFRERGLGSAEGFGRDDRRPTGKCKWNSMCVYHHLEVWNGAMEYIRIVKITWALLGYLTWIPNPTQPIILVGRVGRSSFPW